jgi:prepilin-type N-terminal cleavage/methylation domain-containing protein
MGFRRFYSGFSSKAFTLIELLIVVAIIAILAAIAVPNFLEAQTRSKVSRTLADMRSLATGIEAYCADCNCYPCQCGVTNQGAVQCPLDNPRGSILMTKYIGFSLTTPVAYLTTLFKDPFASSVDGPEPDVLYYFYHNFEQTITWYRANTGKIPNGLRVRHREWGEWVLVARGPDCDRRDIEDAAIGSILVNGFYDPTNGTVSNGDILRSQKYSSLAR